METKIAPNNGVQGTLHKVSGPLTPDVGCKNRKMKPIFQGPLILACLVMIAQGCRSTPPTDAPRGEPAKHLDEVRIAATAFKMKPETDRTVEGKRLSAAIDSILVFNGKRTTTGPESWTEEIGSDDISSPLAESQLIEWAGEPSERDSSSLTYLMKRYSKSEGPQAESLVIRLRRGIVVGTSRSVSARYY